jgi:glutamate-5-semialdehyde dehydrogenase
VAEHSTIPTIQHYKGVNHAFVDAAADEGMARRVCVSGKTSAPATCNALECVLVHRDVAERVVPMLLEAFGEAGVQVRGCPLTVRLAGKVVAAAPEDFGREFLDLIVAMKIVSGLDEAVAHIAQYGSGHSECIVTQDEPTAAAFIARVQASCVLHNASTRMNDGGALGLGAEIGISTTRLHAYGPMGLEDLTIQRYVCVGTGQTR